MFSIGFSGTPVKPLVDVIPREVNFGLVTLGCGSPEERVTIYNVGSADLVVGEPTVDPNTTPPTFQVTATSNASNTWPHTISPGGSLSVLVRFYARQAGLTTGQLLIPTVEAGSAGPPVAVPLQGSGTTDQSQTDIFDQAATPKVDVLWVVDDSSSMQPEQDLMAQNLGEFFRASNVANADYHIAFTTTLTTNENCIDSVVGGSGNSNGGGSSCDDDPMSGMYTACRGNDHIITPQSSDPQGQFRCDVQVSQLGNLNPARSGSDSAEGGFRAAYNFLTPPKIDDPAANGGFLRPDAKLSIIMISDEPEQSRGPVDLYVDFFRTVKGFRNDALVSVSAIATDPGGCNFQGTDIPDPGTRYSDMVTAMNGRFQSLCASDWTTTMANLGLDSVGLQVQFFLSRGAEAASLHVCVRPTGPASACAPVAQTSDGAATGYFYDATTNSIVFNGGSVPPRGARIEACYQNACF